MAKSPVRYPFNDTEFNDDRFHLFLARRKIEQFERDKAREKKSKRKDIGGAR